MALEVVWSRPTIAGEAVAGVFAFMHGKLLAAIARPGDNDDVWIWAYLLAHHVHWCQQRAWSARAIGLDVHAGEV